MTLIKKNGLKGTYLQYTANSVKSLVEQVPKERRRAFAEEILARAFLFGYENKSALQRALKHLAGEQGKKEGKGNA